jgi:hypothetical protein
VYQRPEGVYKYDTLAAAYAAPANSLVNIYAEVGPGGYCSPRHPAHSEFLVSYRTLHPMFLTCNIRQALR